MSKAVNAGLMTLTKLDVVGHSLGAHAAGYGDGTFSWLLSNDLITRCQYFGWKVSTTWF